MHGKPRNKRVRSIANSATSIEDALARAAANGIILAESEKQDIQDAIAVRAFMVSPAGKVYYGIMGFCNSMMAESAISIGS
jgi:hypothetical protein